MAETRELQIDRVDGEAHEEELPKYDRVVCIGVDGSPMAWFAFTYYIDHLHQPGNFVVIIHAFELPMLHSFQEMYVSPEMWQTTLKREADRTVDMESTLMDTLRDHAIPGKFVARGGKPGELLVQVAEEEGADLVVVGTRGQGKLRKTIMGSVSGYVTQHAPCPVVICRRKGPRSRHASETSNPRSRSNSTSETPRSRHNSGSPRHERQRCDSCGSDSDAMRRRKGPLAGLFSRSRTSSTSSDVVAPDGSPGVYRKAGDSSHNANT